MRTPKKARIWPLVFAGALQCALTQSGYGRQAAPGPVPAAQVAPAQARQTPGEVLNNATVVKMVEAKLGDELIISKIKSSPSNFDTSIDAILKLKDQRLRRCKCMVSIRVDSLASSTGTLT